MAQPIRREIKNPPKPKKQQTTRAARIKKYKEKIKSKQEYGTSKLEERFAHNFLDKLGVKYVYQFKAKSIGRYYDFRIDPENRGPIIEIQGSYWHADPRIYEGKNLNKTQIRDLKVDEIKRQWCARNGVKLIYIWELDINNKPDEVMRYLREVLRPYIDGTINEMKKRH